MQINVGDYMNLFEHGHSVYKRQKRSLEREILETFLKNVPFLLTLTAPSLLIGYIEGWTVGESLYFCSITATTGKKFLSTSYIL